MEAKGADAVPGNDNKTDKFFAVALDTLVILERKKKERRRERKEGRKITQSESGRVHLRKGKGYIAVLPTRAA
eukprot:430659-Pelagomonas_calceolata.AAC.1